MEPDNWQAGSDARTLAEAEGIKADKKRHGAAKKHAQSEATKMMAVAKTPSATGKAGHAFPQPKGGVNPKASTAKPKVVNQGMGKPVAKRSRK